MQREFSSSVHLLFIVIDRLSPLTPAQTHCSSRFIFLETSASGLLNLGDQQTKEIQACAFVVCSINYDIIIQTVCQNQRGQTIDDCIQGKETSRSKRWLHALTHLHPRNFRPYFTYGWCYAMATHPPSLCLCLCICVFMYMAE